MNTHEFADVVHGEQPDERTSPDDRHGMARMALQPLERGIEHVRGIRNGEIALHDRGHGRLLIAPGQGRQQVAAAGRATR